MPLIVSCWFTPEWAGASRTMNVPLIIGEGSTDAAAHQYPDIFNETTFALYEINLYTRLCALCQPLSILQWQLTPDYSVLWGDGEDHKYRSVFRGVILQCLGRASGGEPARRQFCQYFRKLRSAVTGGKRPDK